MTDKEKINTLWSFIKEFSDYIISLGDDTDDAIYNLYEAGASDKLLLALGFTQSELDDYDKFH